MEAFRDMELDTLRGRGGWNSQQHTKEKSDILHWSMTPIVKEHQVD